MLYYDIQYGPPRDGCRAIGKRSAARLGPGETSPAIACGAEASAAPPSRPFWYLRFRRFQSRGLDKS